MNLKIFLKIFFLNLIIFCSSAAQQENIKFDHFSVNSGLSQNSVRCLVQDYKGFLWFGTQDGLNRFDGRKFVIYRHLPGDSTSLPFSSIWSIIEDSSQNLWIGSESGTFSKFNRETDSFTHYKIKTENKNGSPIREIFSMCEDDSGFLWLGTFGNGIFRFDRKNKSFISYINDPENPKNLSSNIILTIYPDNSGILWIGTLGGGLNRLNPGDNSIICYKNNKNDIYSLSENNVFTVCEDRNNVLWIGTEGGLNKFNRKTEKFTRYNIDYKDKYGISGNRIRSILEDDSGDFWIGSYDGGISKFSRESGTYIRYVNNPDDPFSLSNNKISSVYEDRSGIIWVGTWVGGINKYDKYRKKFKSYYDANGDIKQVNQNIIMSIREDGESNTWMGTWGGGLRKFNKNNKSNTYYVNDPDDINSISSNNISAIHIDKSGLIWAGTSRNGINVFNPGKNTFKRYNYTPETDNCLSNDDILSVFEDSMGRIWIGTHKGGLNRFDRGGSTFTHYLNDRNDPASISHNKISVIIEGKPGILWIGTSGGGLEKFYTDNEIFKHYRYDPNKTNSISSNFILSIHRSKTGILWVGTENGLNRYDERENKFKIFTKKDGLPNNYIYGILEDDSGNLWLSTNSGLSNFDQAKNSFNNYNIDDGLQSNEFNRGSYLKSSTGEMYFGGVNGYSSFFPSKINKNLFPPQIVITDFQINNKQVDFKKDHILQKPITETSELKLPIESKILSFEFAALHYSQPGKNTYACKMENFEKEWRSLGTRNFATYTNLPAGKYTLRVKGASRPGIWSLEETTLRIIITPPFWKALWFRSVITGVLIILVTTAYKTRIRRIKKKQIFLEKHQKQLKNHQEQLEKHQGQLEFRIKKQQNTEKLLKESEKQYRSIVQDQSAFIVRWRPDGINTFVNEALCKHFKISPEDVIGTGFFPVLKRNHLKNIKKHILTLTPGDSFFYEDSVEYVMDGVSGYYQWSHRAIFDDDKRIIVEYQSVGRDITRQKQFEFQLKQSTDELRKLSNYLQSVREMERAHIAHEIHDELGHNLTVLKMDLKLMNQSLPEKSTLIPERIKGMIEIIDNTITAVKRLSTELRPGVLDELGLNSALEWLIRELKERTNIDYNMSMEFNDKNLSKDFATAVFRISQEALTNAVRHSGATCVNLELKEQNDKIFLKIKDNGTGIGKEKTDSSESFGLIGLRERAYAIGGKLEIEGKENEGTVLSLVSPILRQET